MKPKLKINNIDNLHDARYCAAVGIQLMAFDLDVESDGKMEVAKVKEMIDWLSGPKFIGEFGFEAIDEIEKVAERLELPYVSLPADYAEHYLEDFSRGLIFRTNTEFSEASLEAILEKAANFPEALLDIRWEMESEADLAAFDQPGIMARCIFNFSDPAPIYQLLEKSGNQCFGFSLGEFVEEPGGALDYQACDDFVERYNEIPA